MPFVSFLISFIISEKYSWILSFIAPFLSLLSAFGAVVVLIETWNEQPIAMHWNWFSVAGIQFTAGILIDNLSALMLMIVTLISFLVHVYSTGYMAGDSNIRTYFGMLGFFTFAMLGIVVAGNLLLIFIFWELVGFSSYMLIGHWQYKPEAADAAKRAFIFNRIGDTGFLISLMVLWTTCGTFDLNALASQPLSQTWSSVAALGIFCGVAGKSAQFPLFSWLPKAMEGPTPVSALIHAATMVAAGVFLLARVFFLLTPVVLDIIIIAGSITALAGALAALAQVDIKRILAFSTISQLGLMVMAIGAGSPSAAILHLFAHAFFKACLFLSAGAVIHTLHQAQHQSHMDFDVQDIRNLGGLRKKLPFTFFMFVISGAALAGLPLFTGFASKEAILDVIILWKGPVMTWRWLILVSAFGVTFLTAVYTFRMIWGIFYGKENATAGLTVSEAPPVMRAPMFLLAVACIWIGISINPLDYNGWIYNGLHPGKDFHFNFLAPLSAGWVALALWIAYWSKERSFSSSLLLNAFHTDRLINAIIERPAFQLAGISSRFDKKWIDGVLHTAAYLQLIVAHVTGWVDRGLVDGSVNAIAWMTKELGSFTRSFQGGKIQLYIFWTVFTIIIFIIWTLL